MAKQITRDRKLTPEEAAKYRKIREEVELENRKSSPRRSRPVARPAVSSWPRSCVS
jgi:hypothetical protein